MPSGLTGLMLRRQRKRASLVVLILTTSVMLGSLDE
jgi:hypothetical protein